MRWGLPEAGSHELTPNVFLFLRELRLEAEPEDGPTAVVIGRGLVNVDEDGFTGDVDEVERSLFLRVAVKSGP